MQAITSKDVEHVARLARLGLTKAEAEEYAAKLASVLVFGDKLAACEMQDVAPTFYAVSGENEMRADQCQSSMPQELVLKHAPDRYEDFFRVPRMLED
jgi:aspartyl-tRNA(Asn)/glutamyl-tRNA(Gln) amidotransferase subunit C